MLLLLLLLVLFAFDDIIYTLFCARFDFEDERRWVKSLSSWNRKITTRMIAIKKRYYERKIQHVLTQKTHMSSSGTCSHHFVVIINIQHIPRKEERWYKTVQKRGKRRRWRGNACIKVMREVDWVKSKAFYLFISQICSFSLAFSSLPFRSI